MNNKSVLLIDDEQDWLNFGSSSLTRTGFSVEISTSIRNALPLCQKKQFSLVLIDFNSMEQDEKLFRDLIFLLNKQHVVVLSPMDLSPEKLRKTFNLGVFDCVEKCYDSLGLQRLVEKQFVDINQKTKR